MTAPTTSIPSLPPLAARMTLTGCVQGIGMRPAIARFARQLSLTGYVGNTHEGVEVQVEGAAQDVVCFERELRTHLPAAAEVTSLRSVRVEPTGFPTFRVGQEANLPAGGREAGPLSRLEAPSAYVPQDRVACEPCLAEVQNTENRRHGYAFTSCTACGPRYSIIERMPYERSQTSMEKFSLCQACRREYESSSDRRFHAQTNACPDCGPQIWLRDANDRAMAGKHNALRAVTAALRDGKIVALRGLGGYQLLADATSPDAVERLRQRKQRFGKPLAVMVATLAEAAKFARLDDAERRLLSSPAGPIVIAVARGHLPLASAVTAELNTVGLMLPTTPLHWLVLHAVQRPLVCTSANVEGDPLVYQAELAVDQLRGVADCWLEHDRPIRRPLDDSVARVIAGRPVALRLARGYAPLPLDVQCDAALIALGGHQKTSLALCNGAQAVLGPHIGDLNTVAARQRQVEQVAELSHLYGVDGGQFVCDRHPEYFTTEWAETQSRRTAKVQHHHAHIVAGMLEHGWLDRQVLGVAFDGTGFGDDGTIWGGEFLTATATGYERTAHLRPFALPGGELATIQPWRIATALVRDAAGDDEAARLEFRTGAAKSLLPVLQRPKLSPVTSSAGRLFDGVAALVAGAEQCQFEGQPAMLLEAACDALAGGQYDIAIQPGRTQQLDWRPLVRQLLRDRAAGASPGAMAMRFHRGLAAAVVDVCRCYRSLPVVLGGGVFQNRVLVELLAERFAETGQSLLLPSLIPPNDGGLAAGQLAVAAAWARERRTGSCV